MEEAVNKVERRPQNLLVGNRLAALTAEDSSGKLLSGNRFAALAEDPEKAETTAAASTAVASQPDELAAEEVFEGMKLSVKMDQLREADEIRHDLKAIETIAWAVVAGGKSFAHELAMTTKAGLLDRLAVLELAGCEF